METKLNGYTLKIVPDEDPINPRTDCDHLGTMLCWHRRYTFGDDNPYGEPEDFWESEDAKNIFCLLPLYMLDHSGTYLSTTDFHDPWDSGRLGFIYCTREQAEKWTGNANVTEAIARDILADEVEIYDAYLNGSYYGFFIEGQNGEVEDSCWGFACNGDMRELMDDMKEQVNIEFVPLFNKLAARLESGSTM